MESTSSNQQGEALELITYNVETGKFHVGQRALAILRDIRTPLSVVAVCGRARQGKSFILNQLLQVTGGFQIGSTTRPCTKGLWMWSTPQKRVDEDGKEYHIVLLDTEGIDAYDQTAQYSTQIFSLAVLLSSLFVYNQMGGIDEAALDRLSLVTEMTKHIKVRTNSKGTDRELREFTPSFLWLLRDFYLRLEDEHGRTVTPNDYLETALMPVGGLGAAVEAKNAIRTSIKGLFPDRDCATLVRPMHDELALVTLDHIQPEQLRPEFRDGVASLLKLILQKAQPKHLGTYVLSGPVLAGLTEAYVQAINDGAVPTIATAWQGVAEQECRRAADVAEAAYAAAFDEGVVPEEAALDEEHARCLSVAAAAFEDAAVGEERIRAAHKAKYMEGCAARFAQVRARKLAEAAATVNELLLKASTLVSSALATDGDPQHVQEVLGQFLDQYVRLAAGPLKWVKLVEFLKATYPRIVNEMLGRQEAQARSDVKRLAEELALAHKQISSSRSKADKAEAELADSTAAVGELKRRVKEQAHELAAYKVDNENKAGKVSALEAQVRELQLVGEKRLLSVQQEADAAARQARVAHEQEVTALQSKLAGEQRRVSELAAELAESEGRLAGLSGQLGVSQAEGSEYLAKYSSAKSEVAGLSRQLEECAKSEVAGLSRQLEEARVQLAALQVQKQLAERQRDEAEAAVAELEAQLEEIGAEIADHMAEAEAEQQRAKSMTSASGGAGAAAGSLAAGSPSRGGSVSKTGAGGNLLLPCYSSEGQQDGEDLIKAA
ncbi:hypothetical protein OEZ85_000766 [Tetradesmus obliquus]|uniref:GB1/RHD3-type G domain-containing protein n=1 Tax=Tetradesmus obliquus TaxID=3088 RepID=A0ABY8UKK3_TETOB|nr:hypothetical protein OEZ85_000766 [Tetradesmus obliquus]